jgi:anti-anti-sigma regulatory factor
MKRTSSLTNRVAQVVAHWTLTGLRRAERSVAGRARRLDRQSQSPLGLVISVVEDPTADLLLLGLRGQLTTNTVCGLADVLAAVPDGTGLHIDLGDVAIGGTAVIDRCELLIDQLEARQVRIRIVGLDPRHPALAGRTQP